jgi:formamidopyrimidine-DNA glycosylase
MPELPEVETVRLQLLHKVLNKPITKIEVFHDKAVGNDKTFKKVLIGKKISDIRRIGKLLIFDFVKEKDLFLLAHLRMTGQFFYVDSKGTLGGGHSENDTDGENLPHKHTRIAIHFKDKSTLYFNDMRLFGYINIADADAVEKAIARFGQEPIDPNFNNEKFTDILSKRKTSIKAVLLNQTLVAGLGNIYVDEALFTAKVRPTRLANEVTKKEAVSIAKASGDIMNKAIAVGGTTFQHFKDTGGETGNYTDFLKVFGKQNTPCPVCGTKIKKIKVAGRGTHYCPNCQK